MFDSIVSLKPLASKKLLKRKNFAYCTALIDCHPIWRDCRPLRSSKNAPVPSFYKLSCFVLLSRIWLFSIHTSRMWHGISASKAVCGFENRMSKCSLYSTGVSNFMNIAAVHWQSSAMLPSGKLVSLNSRWIQRFGRMHIIAITQHLYDKL